MATKLEQYIEFQKEKFKEFEKYPTKEEFTSSFKVVLDFIKKAVSVLDTKYNETIAKLENIFYSKAEELKKKLETNLTTSQTKLDGLAKEQEQNLNFLRDKVRNLRNGEDGEDGYTPIKGKDYFDGKDGSPDTADQILNKISGLLEIEDIKDLRKELDELRAMKTQRLGGGGFSKMAMTQYFVDGETPTDSGDHLTFTIEHEPSPASSFKLYRSRARQNLTEDYTISGKTITLTVAFDSSSESLICDYIRA